MTLNEPRCRASITRVNDQELRNSLDRDGYHKPLAFRTLVPRINVQQRQTVFISISGAERVLQIVQPNCLENWIIKK